MFILCARMCDCFVQIRIERNAAVNSPLAGQLTRENLMRKLVNQSRALIQHRDRAGDELLAEAITIGLPAK